MASIKMISKKAINANTVVSKMKTDKAIIYVTSVFAGKKDLVDVLFSLAKEQMESVENTPSVCYTDDNGSKNQYQDCAVS